jgi:hypothetical protein
MSSGMIYLARSKIAFDEAKVLLYIAMVGEAIARTLAQS